MASSLLMARYIEAVFGEGREILIDGGADGEVRSSIRRIRLCQKQETILPTSCLVMTHPGFYCLAGGHCRDRIPGQKSTKRQDSRILPGKEIHAEKFVGQQAGNSPSAGDSSLGGRLGISRGPDAEKNR